MAEYCSQCSPFKEEGGYDFDLFKMALYLDKSRSASFLCEGCNNRAVYKDDTGLIYLLKKQSDGTVVMVGTNLDELLP